MKYRKRPVDIDAEELIFSTDSQDKIINWARNYDVIINKGLDGSLIIETLEGKMKAVTGDFVIKGVNNEFYPCKPDVFIKTYEKL